MIPCLNLLLLYFRQLMVIMSSKYFIFFYFFTRYFTGREDLAVWLSGNELASINVVALRQTRLVSRWVTVCGLVNHLCE